MRIYQQVYQAIQTIKSQYINDWDYFVEYYESEDMALEAMVWDLRVKLYDNRHNLSIAEYDYLRACFIEDMSDPLTIEGWTKINKYQALEDVRPVMKNYRRGLLPEAILYQVMGRIFDGWEVRYYA